MLGFPDKSRLGRAHLLDLSFLRNYFGVVFWMNDKD